MGSISAFSGFKADISRISLTYPLKTNFKEMLFKSKVKSKV